MPSIKVLNISLVLLCIFITSFLCTFLAITSSNKALDDTKHSRDDSVSSCFAVGSESVTNRTTDYLDLLMKSTVEAMVQFTKEPRLFSMAVGRELMARPWDSVKYFEWHRLERYFNTFKLLKDNGNTGVLLFQQSRVTIVQYEDYLTVGNPPDGYHALRSVINYGDYSPWGGINRTFQGTANSMGFPVGVANPLTDVNWINNATYPCALNAVATNGSVPDDPCLNTVVDPLQHTFYIISSRVPENRTLWSSPLPIGKYLAISCFTPLYFNGSHKGFVSSGVDLRHASKFLSDLHIGGPVDGYPSRGRVFVTVRSTWLDPREVGKMIGASHGETIKWPSPSVLQSLYPYESEDHIISSVANATIAEGLDIENILKSGNMTVLSIMTDLAPEGEEFYYRVGVLSDEYGVDWYVHLVIDRAYIMGSIDQKVGETHRGIKASEKKVDDDLKTARTVLYICVVAVAVGLTILSVVFVIHIVEPLVVLEQEMAAVAVMRLEDVDTKRPLSALEEVRLMQVSFLQMIRNLVEYRNYMPASVLQGSDEEESELSGGTQSSTTKNGGTHTHRSSDKVDVKVHVLANAEVYTKRVALMVCNIVNFLQVNDSLMATLLSKYLAAGLHHLKQSKGIPDSFSGDRLYASWNGVRPCASHRTAAYMCARSLLDDTSRESACRICIGLVSGEVKCGNMGCEGMKKYSYIGSLSSWVHVVERIGRSMECEVAIDGAVNEEVCNKAYTRMLQHVVFKKHRNKVLRVYEAMKPKKVAEEEWMYQLAEGEGNDPNKAYNSSYELFMEGRVEEAMHAVASIDDGSKVMKHYVERLRKAVLNPVLCEPLGKHDLLYN